MIVVVVVVVGAVTGLGKRAGWDEGEESTGF